MASYPGFPKRLRQAIDAKFGSRGARRFARQAGFVYDTVVSYLSGKSMPGADILRRMAESLEVTTDWLLGKADSPAGRALLAVSEAPSPFSPGARVVRVPVFDIQAGTDVSYGDAGYPVGQSDRFQLVEDLDDEHAFGLDVHGDSMDDGTAKGIPEGSRLVVSPRRVPKPGDLVVARFENGEVTIKELVPCGAKDHVQLHPWNPRYHDIVKPTKEIAAVWKVVLVVRRLY